MGHNWNNISDFDDEIYVQAAEWVEILGEEKLDTVTRKRLQRWLAVHPSHRIVLIRMIASWSDPVLLEALKEINSKSSVVSVQYRKKRGVLWAGTASIAALVCFALLKYSDFMTAPVLTEPALPMIYRSELLHQEYQLEDGTKVMQGAASELSVLVNITQRRVDLHQGAAFFDVYEDPLRPFKVYIGSFFITALGTEFNIDITSLGTDILVYEGSIEISNSSQGTPKRLQAGEKIRVLKDGFSALTEFNTHTMVDWRSGFIHVDNESIIYLLEQLNRYSRQQVKYQDDELKNMHIAGVFELRNMKKSLDILSTVHPLVVKEENGNYLVKSDTNKL